MNPVCPDCAMPHDLRACAMEAAMCDCCKAIVYACLSDTPPEGFCGWDEFGEPEFVDGWQG